MMEYIVMALALMNSGVLMAPTILARLGNRRGGNRTIAAPAQETIQAEIIATPVRTPAQGDVALFQRTAIATAAVSATVYTAISNLLTPPEGYPWIVSLSVLNNDIEVAGTDNSGIESFRIRDSSRNDTLWGPVNYGIGTSRVQADVSAQLANQPGIMGALVNRKYTSFFVEARASIVATDVILTVTYGNGPVNGWGYIDFDQTDLLRFSFVATANIGTTFEDFFDGGDISIPDAEHPWVGACLIQNDEIGDTLGLARWRLLAADESTVLHGPSAEGIGSGALQGDVSLTMISTYFSMPSMVNRMISTRFNIQGEATVDTDGTACVIFSRRPITKMDYCAMWGG